MSERKLVCLDCESTGVVPDRDRIIELAIIDADGAVLFNSRFNPEIPIPEEASKVHGIYDRDIAECQPFSSFAKGIHELLENADILGFGVSRFDMAILEREFWRSGVEWDFRGLVIDVGTMYQKLRPRTLAAAAEEYLGEAHADSHAALGDTLATLGVFRAMCGREEALKGLDRAGMAKFSQYGEMPYIDIAGKLVRDKDNKAVYNFGKSKGVRLEDDPGLAEWMLNKDFPANTLRCVRDELAAIYKARCPQGEFFPDNEERYGTDPF